MDEIITKFCELAPFSQLDFHGIGHVHIQEGDTPSCKIEAHTRIMPYIVTQVVNNTLVIRYRHLSIFPPIDIGPINFYVTVNGLRKIRANGAGSIHCPHLASDQFDLVFRGAGAASLTLDAVDINTSISGASRVQLAGKATRQSVEINGAGACLAEDLQSQWCRVSVNGAGKAKVSVAEHLDATISGAGRVLYRGNPTIQQRVSGAGAISRI